MNPKTNTPSPRNSRMLLELAVGVGLPALAIFFGSALASVDYVRGFSATPAATPLHTVTAQRR